ncbi:CD59 glycoprotein [Lampris incognitus]|uniref:CD59 glycoprotein n=1 Tax=Lampris incognitus TaxID=2546036 RepID=UPI0024B5666B|nr:CD59 glycoprotein [Lampris incognitus]
MKLVVLALALALLFAAGDALDCHRCISRKAGGQCESSVETCAPEKDACAAAKFLTEPYGQYQKCMTMLDCQMLKINAFVDISCCNSDMCNEFSGSETHLSQQRE